MAEVNRLSQANVYIEGASMLGKAEEVDLPEIKWGVGTHKALGMLTSPEYPTTLEAMKAKFKWTSFYPEIFAACSDPNQALRLQVYGNLQTYQGSQLVAERSVVVFMRGWFPSQKQGSFKAGGNVETEGEFHVGYYRLVCDGEDILEIDTETNVYKVGSVDRMAVMRNNLGL